MKSVLQEALSTFTSILREQDINYAMIGAIASGIYGLPRTTYDIDILLYIEKMKIPTFLKGLKDKGFSFDEKHIALELKEGYLSEVHYKNVRIDILLPILPYFKRVIERANTFCLFGNEIRFATCEDLIILKLLSNRERDREDVKEIGALQLELNISYIRDSLKSLVGEGHLSFITFQQIFEKKEEK